MWPKKVFVNVFLFSFLPILFEDLVTGLKIRNIWVPSKVVIGERIWLNCSYDLESDQLYSLKWYKDSEEIYRFLPSAEPARERQKKYPTEGLKLDLSKTREGNVSASVVDVTSKGEFRCEVSAEAPSFQTARESKMMRSFRTHEDAESSAKRRHRSLDIINLMLMTAIPLFSNRRRLLPFQEL